MPKGIGYSRKTGKRVTAPRAPRQKKGRSAGHKGRRAGIPRGRADA